MVEIFKTNVQDVPKGNKIIKKLLEHFPSYSINFDLSDCDRILRIESNNGKVDIASVMNIVRKLSAEINLIPD